MITETQSPIREQDTSELAISYEGIEPSDSLFSVDRVAIEAVLRKLGLPIHQIVIRQTSPGIHYVAQWETQNQRIVFNQDEMLSGMRECFHSILEQLGDASPPPAPSILLNTLRSLHPKWWPYYLVDEKKDMLLFAGNKERMKQYLQHAKQGKLMPNESLEYQRARAKKHISKLMKLAFRRNIGNLLAHEFEHAHNERQKFATKIGLAALPIIIGTSVISTLISKANELGIHNHELKTGLLLLMTNMMVGTGYGYLKGMALDEQLSFNAGEAFFDQFIPCITVNEEVFERDILQNSKMFSKLVSIEPS